MTLIRNHIDGFPLSSASVMPVSDFTPDKMFTDVDDRHVDDELSRLFVFSKSREIKTLT